MTTLACIFFVLLYALVAIWLYGRFCWERGYNARCRDQAEYETRRELPSSNVEVAMRFLKERK